MMYILGSLLGDIHYFTFVPCLCEGVVHVHEFVGVQRSPISLTCFSLVVPGLFLQVLLVHVSVVEVVRMS